MNVALVLFALAFLSLSYAVGLGIHWINKDSRKGEKDNELHKAILTSVKSNEKTAKITHNAIHALIKEMREDRNERKNNPK